MPTAAYDQIADWYEHEFLGGQARGGLGNGADPLGIDQVLADLLAAGDGICLDIGCGTGVAAARVRELGWTPVSASTFLLGCSAMPCPWDDLASGSVGVSCRCQFIRTSSVLLSAWVGGPGSKGRVQWPLPASCVLQSGV